MHRRDLLRQAGAAALGLGLHPFIQKARADDQRKNVLMFTRSQTFEHSVVKRGPKGELSLAERIVTDLAKKNNFDVTCTKDGRVFLPETIAKFDLFLFETTGDLTKEGGDKNPPMPLEGKKALLDAIASGKGFVGCHCASDTFHSKGRSTENQTGNDLDPYIAMLGGEFISHGRQQKAWSRVTDDQFPGAKGLKDFEINEEWYSLRNFAPDMHVILVQDTKGMVDWQYARKTFPITWARMHGKGRVFYTSMGHREDVWESDRFQSLLAGAMAWAVGRAEASLDRNLDKVAPDAMDLPKQTPPPAGTKGKKK